MVFIFGSIYLFAMAITHFGSNILNISRYFADLVVG